MSEQAGLIQSAEKTQSLVEQLNERAKQAQAQRKATPLARVGVDVRTIPQKEIISRICKDKGQARNDEKGKNHYLFIHCDEQTMKSYANKGYEFPLENGDLVRHEQDVLVCCPTEMYEDTLAATVADADRRLAGSMKKHRSDSKKNTTVVQEDNTLVAAKVGPKRGRPPKSDD